MIQSVVLMVALYTISIACAATYTQLMAHVTQGFLHNIRDAHVRPDADAAHPLLRHRTRAATS